MKVIHLLCSNRFSGAENVVCQIIRGFKKIENFEMFYCSKEGKNKETLENKNIKWIKMNKFSFIELKKIINEYNIAIIHAHDIKASLLASLFSNKCTIISHVHANHENMRKINVKTVLYNLVRNRFRKIIWISNSAFDNYVFKEKIKNKSKILYNVIDEKEIFEKASLDEYQDDYDVIYLGRLTYQKNPLRLISLRFPFQTGRGGIHLVSGIRERFYQP